MTKPFRDNKQKGVVRNRWDTPLLRFLHEQYGIRYLYMGLPGVDLIDVILWKDMIERIIAFEPPDDSTDGHAAITALRRNMKVQSIQGVAYFGSFEEVVILRQDFEGQDYEQGKVVTLYNLDFCDEITSKIETREQGKKLWRFEAIRQVLRDQATYFERDGAPRHFIMMLTIRNQIKAGAAKDLLSTTGLYAEAKDHYTFCKKGNPFPAYLGTPLIGTHTWALKTLVFNSLSNYFNNPCLSVLFFPPVLYTGTPIYGDRQTIPSPMIHWIVLCRFADPEQVSVSTYPASFLREPCVAVDANGLVWSPQTGEINRDATKLPDPVAWLNTHGADVFGDLVVANTVPAK